MDIAFFLIFLGTGFLTGRSKRFSRLSDNFIDRALTWIVFLLLFAIGLEIGGYSEIFSQMGVIGLQAVAIAAGATVGGSFFCMLLLGNRYE